MKKVLVPTDFSANSKSGIRFAIHWAAQQQLELIFLHVYHILRPIEWTDLYFDEYAERTKNLCRSRIENFIHRIYKSVNETPGRLSYVILEGISPDVSIMDYCRKNKGIDFICISTRGAGRFKRILGTNTGNLITKSEVPVLAVPQNYRTAEIKKILYATDLQDYTEELEKVLDFAMPFKASVDVLHFVWSHEIHFDKKMIETAFNRKYKYDVRVYFDESKVDHSLIQRLTAQINLKKPSVVIMFTNQERTFFQKLFIPSKAEELSYHLETPLLVFKKNEINEI